MCALRVNETKIKIGSAFNGDQFGSEGNRESGNNNKSFFRLS